MGGFVATGCESHFVVAEVVGVGVRALPCARDAAQSVVDPFLYGVPVSFNVGPLLHGLYGRVLPAPTGG
jgi:hypothetical protein